MLAVFVDVRCTADEDSCSNMSLSLKFFFLRIKVVNIIFQSAMSYLWFWIQTIQTIDETENANVCDINE